MSLKVAVLLNLLNPYLVGRIIITEYITKYKVLFTKILRIKCLKAPL